MSRWAPRRQVTYSSSCWRMSCSCKRASKALPGGQGQADLFGFNVERGTAEGVDGRAGPFTPAGGDFQDDRPLHDGSIACGLVAWARNGTPARVPFEETGANRRQKGDSSAQTFLSNVTAFRPHAPP